MQIEQAMWSNPFWGSSEETTPVVREELSVFYVAMPHAVAALAGGAMGAVLAANAATTFFAVVGVIVALVGAYCFVGVVGCAVANSGDPKGYRANIGKTLVTVMGAALADIISTVAQGVLIRLISGRR